MSSLGDAVLERRTELRVAVGRDRNEYQGPFAETRRPSTFRGAGPRGPQRTSVSWSFRQGLPALATAVSRLIFVFAKTLVKAIAVAPAASASSSSVRLQPMYCPVAKIAVT